VQGWRWLNMWIPIAIAYTVAAYAASPFGGLAFAAVLIAVWVIAYYPAVVLVGFLTGLVGHAPREQSMMFSNGFNAGYRLFRRT
jgi:hypothetical protein